MDQIVATLHRRTVLSAINTFILQAILLFLLAFSNFDIVHPISWINSAVTKLSFLSVWVMYLILCVLLTALCGVMKTRILCGPCLVKSRFVKLRRIFSINTVFQACLYMLIGITISCLYLTVIGGQYSSLQRGCNYSSGFCVLEEKVFLLYSGVWSGIYVFFRSFFKSYSIHFPVIQQLKFLRLKAEIFPSLKQAMKGSVVLCIFYPLLYFMNGSVFLHVVCDLFNLTWEDKLFSNFTDYLKLSLLFYAWLQCTILIFSCEMMERILNIYLTDLPEFPIASKFGEGNVGTLHEVIAANKYPVIQNWGCLDLYCLAKSDECRRKEIFALSQPGGHPNNWNAIRKECLQLIDSFVENMNIAVTEMISSQTENTDVPATLAPQEPRITREMSPNVRNLSLGGQNITFPCETLNDEPLGLWHKVFELIILFVKGFISPILKKTGLNHIFDKFPNAQLKYVLSNSLPVINAVQGLSFLVAASLTEDEYGVVRKDLNTIIIAIQQMKLTVDRAFKLGNLKRVQKSDCDVQMKVALKCALRRSLYKICIAFRDHIQELELPSSVYNNLQVYMTFKE